MGACLSQKKSATRPQHQVITIQSRRHSVPTLSAPVSNALYRRRLSSCQTDGDTDELGKKEPGSAALEVLIAVSFVLCYMRSVVWVDWLEMGVVKLVLPKFLYHRAFLPANRNWKRNFLMAWVQVTTLSLLIYQGAHRWYWATARRGVEVADPAKKYARAIKIL